MFTFAILFGIGSFSLTVVAWNVDDYYYYYYDDYIDEYYDDDYYDVAAISLGAICELLGIIAIPLAFVAARTYLRDRNALGVTPGPCLIGWPIAAWIIYAIIAINGLAAVIVGAVGGLAPPAWVAFIVIFLSIGWGLMVTYTELARRRQSIGDAAIASAPVTNFSQSRAARTRPSEILSGSSDRKSVTYNPAPFFIPNIGCRPSIPANYPATIDEETMPVAVLVDNPRPLGTDERKRTAVDPEGW